MVGRSIGRQEVPARWLVQTATVGAAVALLALPQLAWARAGGGGSMGASADPTFGLFDVVRFAIWAAVGWTVGAWFGFLRAGLGDVFGALAFYSSLVLPITLFSPARSSARGWIVSIGVVAGLSAFTYFAEYVLRSHPLWFVPLMLGAMVSAIVLVNPRGSWGYVYNISLARPGWLMSFLIQPKDAVNLPERAKSVFLATQRAWNKADAAALPGAPEPDFVSDFECRLRRELSKHQGLPATQIHALAVSYRSARGAYIGGVRKRLISFHCEGVSSERGGARESFAEIYTLSRAEDSDSWELAGMEQAARWRRLMMWVKFRMGKIREEEGLGLL